MTGRGSPRHAAAILAGILLACDPAAESAPGPDVAAHYIAAEDGTRLAADVYLPAENHEPPYPALLTLTRYRRGLEDPETGERINTLSGLDSHFLAHGYALVKVDARGSGASFGTRPVEYGRQEVLDAHDVVDWVVSREWSDGTVGAYGTSYTGTTAELLAAVNHPAVKAVIPGWSDFDAYPSPIRPYGLLARGFIETWGDLVGHMDNNNTEVMGAGVRSVDEDRDGSLLAAAVAEHAANPDVFQAVLATEYRDDVVGGDQTWAEIGPIHWKAEIEASGVPMLVLVSWMDAGTADGTLLRFRHFSNPQKVLILASTHGGGYSASPYSVGAAPLAPQPSVDEQMEMRRLFFDHHLKGADNGVEEWPAMRYFNLGEEAYHDTEVWPPPGTATTMFHMDAEGRLTGDAEAVTDGSDEYAVDPEVTTGPDNRWMAQMGTPILNLDDRADMDARMLTYTTEPLESDLQVAGYPVITLNLASDREDGALFVYLEDVDPEGRSRYVTEGGLRLIHRKAVPNPYFAGEEPYHSFARADAEPMPPGEAVTVSFRLWPIAALVRAGHRIRIAIAGADAGMFDPVPADGDATLTVYRGVADGSRIELPVVEGGLRGSGGS
ncbi:MAG: CocE/NonD family hydrolase [Gemmatimonadota bacterium]|nr:CocE/NonD family hydrolase [Gemmatimonadota bacterium]